MRSSSSTAWAQAARSCCSREPVTGFAIRAYRPDDHDALREICRRTGLAGGDATGRWSSDDLVPDLYLTPYVRYAPDHALVVADADDRPVGYLILVPDTAAFVRWWRHEVTPHLPYPRQAEDPDEQWFHDVGHEPERMIPTVPGFDLARYPAHLHIDLLPAAQGRGLGRALMRDAAARLVADGVPGIHLTYDRANPSAGPFYDRLGWRRVVPEDETVRVIEPELLLGRAPSLGFPHVG